MGGIPMANVNSHLNRMLLRRCQQVTLDWIHSLHSNYLTALDHRSCNIVSMPRLGAYGACQGSNQIYYPGGSFDV